jgi:hypothetical protein
MSIHLLESNTDIEIKNSTKERIYLFQQFFIHKDPKRYDEIKLALRKNVELLISKTISKIYLLNERIYTKEELGLNDLKELKDSDYNNQIKQVNISNRMMYSDVFKHSKALNANGYIVIANSDIFFDSSISNLNKSTLKDTKSMMALLRCEYTNPSLFKNKIFGPRSDSQDTWIIHSNHLPTKKQTGIFDIYLGKPGCDNKLCYLFYILGYKLYNDPSFIRSYHVHSTQVRDYSAVDLIPQPYLYLFPKLQSKFNISQYISHNVNEEFMRSVKGNYYFSQNYKSHILSNHDSNKKLQEYIANCLNKNEQFIIPRIAGVEHILAMFSYKHIADNEISKINGSPVLQAIHPMKNNAGINILTVDDLVEYSKLYVSAFKHSKLFAVWEHFTNVYNQGGLYPGYHDSLLKICNRENYLSSFCFDIFHHLTNPWTHALKGKRLLIVSNFMDTIKLQIEKLLPIYGVDLFPECKFVFVRPPQTACGNGNEQESWIPPFKRLCNSIYEIKDQFDVALCSCGGYGIPLLNSIYEMGKSAIYVGGVLQMYFGIIGSRWERERPDVIKAFKNDSWTRPLLSEIPNNSHSVEGGCYW